MLHPMRCQARDRVPLVPVPRGGQRGEPPSDPWDDTPTTGRAARHDPRRSGAVVLIGSATGIQRLVARTPYAASEMALVGLVGTLA